MLKETLESRLNEKQRKTLTVISIILVFIFSGVIAILVGKPMIQFVGEPDKFRNFVKSYGLVSDIIFILMVIFQMIIAVIPGEPFEIAAGYAFGAVRGTIDCIIAFALGGALIFLIVRKLGIKAIEVFFPMEKIRSLKFLQNSKKLNTLTFIVFLIPGTPKDLLSYFIGLTNMKFSVWLFVTTVARIPSLITSVLGGSALGNERYEIAVLVFIIALIISGIGLIVYKMISGGHDS